MQSGIPICAISDMENPLFLFLIQCMQLSVYVESEPQKEIRREDSPILESGEKICHR